MHYVERWTDVTATLQTTSVPLLNIYAAMVAWCMHEFWKFVLFFFITSVLRVRLHIK